MKTWKWVWVAVASLLMVDAAQAAVVVKADAQKGKALLEQSCMACHAAKFGGDPTRIYTRPDHKVQNLQQLSARVRACSVNTNTGWFPEDEAYVTQYLNQQYYKFTK